MTDDERTRAAMARRLCALSPAELIRLLARQRAIVTGAAALVGYTEAILAHSPELPGYVSRDKRERKRGNREDR